MIVPAALDLRPGSAAARRRQWSEPAMNRRTRRPGWSRALRPRDRFERDAGAPLLTATELTSFAYQEALKGTPWEYYRLIMTQWPRLEGNQTDPIPASVDGSAPNTFPGTGAFSAFTNVAMETFDQKNVQLGCMSCHNRARMNADFMWTVIDHAYPSRLAPAPR